MPAPAGPDVTGVPSTCAHVVQRCQVRLGQGLPPVPPFLSEPVFFVGVRPVHLFED